MRVVDVALIVTRRMMKRIVELADEHSLSSAVFGKQRIVGSDISLPGVLPTALSALSELLAAVVSGVGQTVCSDDEPTESLEPIISSPNDVAPPPPLDRSTGRARC
jgi:hypothetical protein